jgi:phage shock protein A
MVIFFIFLIVSLFSCKKGEVEQEETPVDTWVQELESQVEELKTDISEKDTRITQLEEERATLESQVPRVQDVQAGDNHWQIAYDYLTQQKNIPDAEAKGVLSRALLFHPILVGFKVWNYFHDGIFGTFITHGSAPVSHKYLVKMEEEKEKQEKWMLEEKIEEMKGTTANLEGKIQEMTSEKESLEGKIDSLNQKIDESQKSNENLTEKLNSLYYLADTKDNLIGQGKIKGSFLGICGMNIKEVSFGDFQNSIDLRTNDFITLTALDLGIPQIKEVELLPKHLDKGVDFRVEISSGGREAKVHLLDKDKFRLSCVLVILN